MIYFCKVPLKNRRLLKKLFARALILTGNDLENISVGIRFANEEEIQDLNRQHRQVDKVTDVLSFPMLDIREGQQLSDFDAERSPNGELCLGDIVLCPKRAKEQAKELGHSFKRELAFLIVHGFLHLLGYDHMEKEEEARMMGLTENILLNFGLERAHV